MIVLVTGSQGFIGTYTCNELLNNGHIVIGVDNYSKYGKVVRPHDSHPNFRLIECDVTSEEFTTYDFSDVDYIINFAAMIGGISYFHKHAYDLLAHNERIMASVFDLAIHLYADHNLKRIIVISSSMVFENTEVYPTPETEARECKPPSSTYGFQKLATEYFCQGAQEQYGVPYTIIRPFNCIGIGEDSALEDHVEEVGNVKMMMSHVLPDLVHRCLVNGPDKPLTILGSGNQVRHYTNGKDLAIGIIRAMTCEGLLNNDVNISTKRSTNVKELAEIIWYKLYPNSELIFEYAEAYTYDVQKRIPDLSKATKYGIECNTPLESTVDEVITYMKRKLNV